MNFNNQPIRINRKQLAAEIVRLEPIIRIDRKNKTALEKFNSHKEKTNDIQPIKKLKKIKKRILVCIHSNCAMIDNHCLEIVYIAQVLAYKLASSNNDIAVSVLCFGKVNENSKKILAQKGADEIYVIDYLFNQTYAPEVLTEIILKFRAKLKPLHLLFADNKNFAAQILRQVIVASDTSFATDVEQISSTHLYRFCENQTQLLKTELSEIIGLKEGLSSGNLPYLCEGKMIKNDLLATCNKIIQTKITDEHKTPLVQLAADEISLEEAQFIISAGNGINDIEQFLKLAQLLRATVGASRVIVDDGKLPRDKQVGLTGKLVKAQVYLALGISGAIQHLQGIENCQFVIAVNQDPSCPMVKRANLALIEDLNILLPKMIAQLQSNKS